MRRKSNIAPQMIAHPFVQRALPQTCQQVCQQHAGHTQATIFGDDLVDQILKAHGPRMKITVHHFNATGVSTGPLVWIAHKVQVK